MKKILTILFFLLSVSLFADELQKATDLAAKKQYDQALQILWAYEKTHPDDVQVHEKIQRIFKSQKKEVEALKIYKDRYENNPTPLNAHFYSLLIESPSEREALARKMREDHPENLWAHYDLAIALLDQDRLEEGVFVAEEGVSKVAQPARLHYAAARIYRRMKEFPKAAEQARQAYKAEASEEYRNLMQAYEEIEISETADPSLKYKLAQQFVGKYRDTILKPESLGDAATLTELAYVYVENGKDVATTKKLVETAQNALKKITPDEDPESKDLFFRTRGSLIALQAWIEATRGKQKAAKDLLKLAPARGAGPETFYFSALTYQVLGDQQSALTEAIKAQTYPPPYPGAQQLASDLWKKIHGSEEGLQTAIEEQKKIFSPRRKQRVTALMVSEDHEPFTITDREGKKITSQDLSGKIILMNFWAVWCPPCREELPHWNQFYAKHKDDPSVVLLAVGDEPWETMTNYMKNQNFDFAVYRNEDYWEEFNIDGIPTLVVLDSSGKIRFRNVGFEEGMEYEETLLWQIEALKQ